MSVENVIETDVLVIGGGIAGCLAAVKAREKGLNVILVDKGYIGKTGATASAGYNFTVYNPDMGNDFNAYMNHIIKESDYLNNREWTEIIMNESWPLYEYLAACGVEFPVEEKEGRFYTIYPPFLQARLIRRQVAPPLRKQALKSGVKIIDKIMITDLLKNDGSVVGAIGFLIDSLDTYIIKAKATVIATGACMMRNSFGEVHELTGDGVAMAYRVGAELTGGDMHNNQAQSAAYPSWRGGRAARSHYRRYYVDATGAPIYYGLESDIALEFIFHAGKAPIYLDLNKPTPEEIEMICKRTATSDALESERIGFDPRKHGKYQLSGGGLTDITGGSAIWPIDKNCASTLTGLYAAGDSCGHMAFWWGGIVPGGITGMRAGVSAAEYALKVKKVVIPSEEITKMRKIMYSPIEQVSGFSPRWITQVLLYTIIPYYILIVQHGGRLEAALTLVEFFRDHYVPKLFAEDSHELRVAHETKNMVLNAEMMLRASLFRAESRSYHYREDYPRRNDPEWLAWVKLREDEGLMKLWKEKIPKKWWPDISKPYEERYRGHRRFPGEYPGN
jgi:succinate dehydrogenase/fumarate reductase flavoprotein subunit